MILPRIIELELPYEEEQDTKHEGLGKDFQYDFKRCDFVLENSGPKVISGKSAIATWIEKVIRTQIYRWPIYKKIPYGTNLEDLIIGKHLPMEVLKSELRRELTEAILRHIEIKELVNWEFELEDEMLRVIFTVVLENDDTIEKVVKFNGRII